MATPSPTPDVDGRQLRMLTAARRHEEARAAAQRLIRAGTADREVMYLFALNLRCLDRIGDAIEFLDQFEREHPGFSRIHQERGHCYLARHETATAVSCFERAVGMNDALQDSWHHLAALYERLGEPTRSWDAARQAAHLAALAPELVLAASLMADQDLERSETVLRDFAADGRSRLTALHLLARVRHARGAWFDAQCLFEEALEEGADLEPLRLDYARLLLDRQKYGDVLAQWQRLGAAGQSRSGLLLYSTACLGLGQVAPAVDGLRRALTLEASPALWLTLGDALRVGGLRDESIDAYGHAAQTGAYAAACWSLANLKDDRCPRPDVARMRAVLAVPAPDDEREALCFAIGSACRDAADYAAAWRSIEAGNCLHRAQHPYEVSRDEALVESLINCCDAAFFASRSGWGVSSADPIFIVGLPRSGSTLVEQMLASHPSVDGTRELGELPALLHDLEGRRPELSTRRYPACLSDLGVEAVEQLGHRYLQSTRCYRGEARLFTDKLPNNFLHVGVIHLLMPRAKIIDVRRGPLDCCVSNLLQRYASGQEFSYDMTDMGRFYRLYLRLMRHWHDVLPGRVLTVRYESLVEDPEGQLRQMLTYCGLDYEQHCLRFHETHRSIATPSSEQVRRPLSTSAIGGWRHFAPWLGPLQKALGDALSAQP